MCLVHEPKHCGMFGPEVNSWLTCLNVVLVSLMSRLIRFENSRLSVPTCLVLSLLVKWKEKLGALPLLTSVSAIRGVNDANLGLVTAPTMLTVRPVPVIDLRRELRVTSRNLLIVCRSRLMCRTDNFDTLW